MTRKYQPIYGAMYIQYMTKAPKKIWWSMANCGNIFKTRPLTPDDSFDSFVSLTLAFLECLAMVSAGLK